MADGQADYRIRITAEQTAALNQSVTKTKQDIKGIAQEEARANRAAVAGSKRLVQADTQLTSKKKALTAAIRGVNTQASRMGQVMGALVSPISIAFTLITAVVIKARREWTQFWSVLSDAGSTDVFMGRMKAHKKALDDAAESAEKYRQKIEGIRTAQQSLNDLLSTAEERQQQRFADEDDTAQQRMELGLAGVTAAEATGQLTPAQAALQREALRASFGKAQIDIRSRARQAAISSRRRTISTLGEAETQLKSRLAGVDNDLAGTTNPTEFEAALGAEFDPEPGTARAKLKDALRRQVETAEEIKKISTPSFPGLLDERTNRALQRERIQPLQQKQKAQADEIATLNGVIDGLKRQIAETTAARKPILERQDTLRGDIEDIVTQRTKLQRDLPDFEARSADDLRRFQTTVGVGAVTRLAEGEAAAIGASSQASNQAVQDLRQGIRSSSTQEAAEWRDIAQEFREYRGEILQRMSEFRRELSDTNAQLKNQRNQ